MREQSDIHRITEEIFYIRYPSERTEDRLGRLDFARELRGKPYSKLVKIRDRMRELER